MAEYKMVVLSNPVPGREQECDQWYEDVHLKDMVKFTGFKSAQRFRLQSPIAESNPYQFLAIYEIETDDLDSTVQELITAAETGNLNVSESLNTETAYAVIYGSCGEVVYST